MSVPVAGKRAQVSRLSLDDDEMIRNMTYPYESLMYAARLSFKDAYGLDAMFECYQRLRVLSPEISCVSHRIWGGGDQLHELTSLNAQLVHQARVDGKDVLVSALDKPAKRGQVIELYSTRRIYHAFKEERESWEYVPYSPTARARVSISFPIAKEPEGISVSVSPGSASPFVRRPGTKELTLAVSSPTIGAAYRTEWSW